MARKEGKMRVAVRVRPFSRQELEANQRTIVRVMDGQNLLFDPEDDDDEFFFHGSKVKHRDVTKRVRKKMPMEYDYVFGAEAVNADIYATCMEPLIASVMEGFNCSVFVYGATGAGKTFTMLGKEGTPGITYLTIQELFRQMGELQQERKFAIGVSYLEVYNEQVMNLLTKAGPLKLREDSSGVVVSGLSLKPIYDAKELIALLSQGNQNRTQHPTDANAESSRSHAIFQVHIRMEDLKTSQKRTVKLSMIDLAGSERASSTKGIGVRFKEGASINKSLLALGNCINKLADGLDHIPYRDSNLTRILKDSLGGNCQTVMIANVSPSSLMYDDTYNTLKYASRAKKIRTTCRQNILRSNLPVEFYAKKTACQEEEIQRLKKIIQQQEEKIAAQASEIKRLEATKAAHVVQEEATVVIKSASLDNQKIDRLYQEISSVTNTLIKIKRNQNMMILKAKFKKNTEEQRKILTLDGVQDTSDISRLEASMDKYSRQMDEQNGIMSELMDKYKTLWDELQVMRKEVQESNDHEILVVHMRNKDLEQKIVSQDQQLLHMEKMISVMRNEWENAKSALLVGCELVQQMFLLMRANNNTMDVNLKRKLQRLQKLIDGKASIKFADEDQNDSFEALSRVRVLDFVGGVAGGKRLQEADDAIFRNPAKRKRLIMDGTVPPVPLFAPASSSGANILSGVEPLGEDPPHEPEMNHTFRVSTVLTDQKRNVTAQTSGPNGVNLKMKSSPKRFNKVNNENKRMSPYRSKKSPKMVRKPIAPVKGFSQATMRNRQNMLEKKDSVMAKFWK
ncbi:kinesin-like protein KIF18A [Phlebotomus argentipes]|uniref:kinesin-like protein KIF18A n=1 Tax=Phlebotomus argentipes TaxID=94469 RepID=UPI00289373F9|nr:kinesin-like protein KIF18A [Phlebotomus argentipes]